MSEEFLSTESQTTIDKLDAVLERLKANMLRLDLTIEEHQRRIIEARRHLRSL